MIYNITFYCMSGSVHTSTGASRLSSGASCGGKQNSCKIGKIAAIVLNLENLLTFTCSELCWTSILHGSPPTNILISLRCTESRFVPYSILYSIVGMTVNGYA